MKGKELNEIAGRVARSWVSFPRLRDDLRQEAALAMVVAWPGFDPKRGVKREHYLEQVGHHAVSRFLAKHLAPVGFPRRVPSAALERPELPDEPSPEDPPDAQIERKRLREEVRERLLYLVGVEGAEQLLNFEGRSRDNAFRRAHYRASQDRVLRTLWRENDQCS
jgi:DNA-directed RNA polymerase specialized sigma subunit